MRKLAPAPQGANAWPIPPGPDGVVRAGFSVDEAAAIFDVHKATLERAIAAGEFELRKVGRASRIPRESLEAWASARPVATYIPRKPRSAYPHRRAAAGAGVASGVTPGGARDER